MYLLAAQCMGRFAALRMTEYFYSREFERAR